jgi:hypothetical protein
MVFTFQLWVQFVQMPSLWGWADGQSVLLCGRLERS